MNDEHFCCNGHCSQGKDCPRFKADNESRLGLWFYAVVLVANIAVLVLWLSGWRHV
jgi:hypothetical protein